MKAYSMDLRERVLADCDEGLKTRAVATKYRVSESWVRRLLQRRRERGEITPRKGSGRRPKWIAYADTLRNAVREQPDITLHELKQRYALPLSVPTLSRTLHRLGLTFKNKVLCAAEQDRPDVAVRRDLWRAERLGIPVRRLVFIDETSASTRMARLRGRSERGKRLISKVPHGHWKTTTFVAALRSDGLTAPVVVDGAMTGEIFLRSGFKTQSNLNLRPARTCDYKADRKESFDEPPRIRTD